MKNIRSYKAFNENEKQYKFITQIKEKQFIDSKYLGFLENNRIINEEILGYLRKIDDSYDMIDSYLLEVDDTSSCDYFYTIERAVDFYSFCNSDNEIFFKVEYNNKVRYYCVDTGFGYEILDDFFKMCFEKEYKPNDYF